MSEPHGSFATSRDVRRNRTAERSHTTGSAPVGLQADGHAASDQLAEKRGRHWTQRTRRRPPRNTTAPRARPPSGRAGRSGGEVGSPSDVRRAATPRPAANGGPTHRHGSECRGTSPHRTERLRRRLGPVGRSSDVGAYCRATPRRTYTRHVAASGPRTQAGRTWMLEKKIREKIIAEKCSRQRVRAKNLGGKSQALK